jgi:dihydrofolate synthase / folylpolyglutamate synthase
MNGYKNKYQYMTKESLNDYLYSFLPKKQAFKLGGEFGFCRFSYLMCLLDNPQNNFKIIHVAGNSGKGSIASAISKLLMASGFCVGLNISPHVLDIRERFQINNEFVESSLLQDCLKNLDESIKNLTKTPFGEPTYFEVITALSFSVFSFLKVDYAVIEVGIGGLLDATNVQTSLPKMCVLTRSGVDHTEILGSSLLEMTFQDAGIIQDNSWLIYRERSTPETELIQILANPKTNNLNILKNQDFNYSINSNNLILNINHDLIQIQDLDLGFQGIFQAENFAMAVLVFQSLALRDDFKISHDNIRQVAKKSSILGRFEVLKHGSKTIVLDVAHNPQKIEGLIESLRTYFTNSKLTFLYSSTKLDGSLDLITPIADAIVLTDHSHSNHNYKKAANPKHHALELEKNNFDNFLILPNPIEAFSLLTEEKSENIIIVTGSFYIVSIVLSFLNIPQDKF